MQHESLAPRIGSVELGSFKLLGLLGQGSFAEAYLAEQLGTDRRAVVKIAHTRLMERTERGVIRQRFEDEVRASTRVQHPNMVTIYMAGETHDGVPAIAMEFVPGDTLEACLERSAPLRTHELVYFSQLASVLATVHRTNIVHRDVSPGNIIITRDHTGAPRAKLLDFGIAQLGDGGGLGPLGTPRFAAPEQITGAAVPRSDVYSLGAILWWAMTGRQYLEEFTSIDEVVSHQLRITSAPDPRTIHHDIPPSIARLTMELLSPKPEGRPSSTELLERWPEAVAEARAWRRRADVRSTQTVSPPRAQRPLRLLIIDSNSVKRHLVQAYAERLGCEVVAASQPRDATRGLLGEFDVAVMSTELPGVDEAAVARHLREHFPKQRLVLMSSRGERVLDCSATGADIHLNLPGELGRLAQYLEMMQRRRAHGGRTPIKTLDPHDPVSGTVIDSWQARPPAEFETAIRGLLGVMPTLITQLDAIGETGPTPENFAVCRAIEEKAGSLGALHLARLAKSLRMLLAAGELDDPSGYIKEIENEYQAVFRRLLHYIKR